MHRVPKIFVSAVAGVIVIAMLIYAAPYLLIVGFMLLAKDNTCIHSNDEYTIMGSRVKGNRFEFDYVSIGDMNDFYTGTSGITLRFDGNQELKCHEIDMDVLRSIASLRTDAYINPTVWPEGTAKFQYIRSEFTTHEGRLLEATLYPADWQQFEISFDEDTNWIALPQTLSPEQAESLFGPRVWTFLMH